MHRANTKTISEINGVARICHFPFFFFSFNAHIDDGIGHFFMTIEQWDCAGEDMGLTQSRPERIVSGK